MTDDATLVRALADDIDRLTALPTDALEREVRCCPGWTVTDLLAHLGRVHHRAIRLVQGAPFVPLDAWEPTPTGPPAVAWSRSVAAELVAAVRGADPDAEAHSWLGPVPSRFWIRRMAQETSIHRWDAEEAAGAVPTPIEAGLGIDGADEFLTVFLPLLPPDRWQDLDGSIHLHATDGEGEWLVELGGTTPTVRREHAKGDVAVRGGGADLDLLLWNRRAADADGIEVFGDGGLLARFLAVARF